MPRRGKTCLTVLYPDLSMNTMTLISSVSTQWDAEIVPQLTDYVRIPAKSPHFDPQWETNGYIERAIRLAEAWVKKQPVRDLAAEIVRLRSRTPRRYSDVPSSNTSDRTVLRYGHLDKQPEMPGWREGYGPWEPLFEDGKLYGRGSADDGYAVFAALSGIGALQAQNVAHSRCVGMIETCEESGSYDLPAYLEALAPRMGRVDFVIGLDSGCGDYERMWDTTSLRGLAGGRLTVEVLTEGVHSGDASGVVPSSFRIARKLLDRVEDATTGRVLPAEFHTEIPAERAEQARLAAKILGETVIHKFPFAGSTQPLVADPAEAELNRTWRPVLSVTDAPGPAAAASSGNVLRPQTSLKLSLRLPPTTDGGQATHALKRLLEADPPHRATVCFDVEQGATGWNAPP